MRALFALTIFTAIFVCAGVSHADGPRRIALLPSVVEGPGGRLSSERAFDELARAAEYRVGLDVVAYNELFVDGAEPIAAASFACGSDTACLSRVLYDARIDFGVRVVVNFGLQPSLVSLTLVDPRTRRIIEESVVEVSSAQALGEAVKGALGPMLDKLGMTRGGRILVVTQTTEVRLRVASCRDAECLAFTPRAPDLRRPDRFTVPVGRHRVEAERDGEPVRQTIVVVEEGREVQVPFDFGPPPGAQREERFVGSGLFWGLVGGAALVAGATVVLLATDPFSSTEPGRGCLCVATEGATCPPCP